MKRYPFVQNPSYLPPKDGEPPLHRAARVGDDDAIRKLVTEGADVNQLFDMRLDPDGREAVATPLMVAAGSGYGASIGTMRLLIELGADAALKTDFGSIARFAAGGLGWNYLPGGDAARLRLCLELGCDPDEIDRRGVSLVADAGKTGDVHRVRVLIEAGASPNVAPNAAARRAYKWNTPNSPFDDDAPSSFQIPLHNAVLMDAFEMVTMLLTAGADVHALDNGHKTALFNARSARVARVLIDAGLNVEDLNCLGWTPLVDAINDGSVDGVRALLSVGANVNATHDHGFTVFMSAASSSERNLDVMRLLIEGGADPHALSDYGWNAFHAAMDAMGAEEAVVRETLHYLKELGLNIEQRNSLGQTPLAKAIVDGTELDVLVLCELGADPNAICKMHGHGRDYTPPDLPLLFHAASWHQTACAEILLRAGADPLATDEDGETALSWAIGCICNEPENDDLVHRALINIDACDTSCGEDAFITGTTARAAISLDELRSINPSLRLSEDDRSCIALLCAHEAWARHKAGPDGRSPDIG